MVEGSVRANPNSPCQLSLWEDLEKNVDRQESVCRIFSDKSCHESKYDPKPIFHFASLFARTDKKVGTLSTSYLFAANFFAS